MIGFFGGLLLALGLIGVGWDPADVTPAVVYTWAGMIAVGGTLLGAILFPRTIGLGAMWLMIGGVIAAIAALIHDHDNFILPLLIVALASFFCQAMVGSLRRDAT